MSKIPRAVVAAGLGVGTYLAVDSYFDPNYQEPYAVKSVNECVSALGNKAIEAAELHEACKPYAESYTPTSLAPIEGDDSRTITFRLPDPIALLQKESPNAAIVDRNIIEANAISQRDVILVAGVAGLAVALVAGNTKTLKRLDNVSFGRRKKGRSEK